MKKLILVIATLTFSIACYSQSFEIGVKGGLNITAADVMQKVSNDLQITNKNTFNGGIYGRFKIKLIGLFVQPELVYNTRGYNFEIKEPISGETINLKQQAYYIDVPVLVGLKMLKFLRIYAGPNFQYLLKNEITGIDEVKALEIDFKKTGMKKASTGVQIGFGLDLLKFRIDVKYDFNPTDMGSPFSYQSQAQSIKTSLITIQLGYKLFGVL
jgi:hypothetical protein